MKIKSYILGVAVLLSLAGCKDDESAPLAADMKCDRTEVSAGETVCFTDQSSGQPAKWEWTFEGGEPAVSNLSCPEVIYNAPGTYSVTLRVSRNGVVSEKVFDQLVSVSYPGEITADFEADKVTAFNTDEVTFSDRSKGFPNSWEWTFVSKEGKKVTSTDQNPVLRFEPGVYTVTLKATSPVATGTVTKEDYLTIIDHDAVAADFAAEGSLMILEGSSITFKDMTMGRPEGWNWKFEGADVTTSTQQNPTVKYSRAGRYKVTLEAYNELNRSTAVRDQYIMVLPASGLAMWFPFDGNLKDCGPKGNIKMEQYSSDTSKWQIDAMAPSRHEGDHSVMLGGDCKTNTDDYAVLQITNPDLLPGGMQATTLVMWVKADGKKGSRMGLFNRGRPAGAITANVDDKDQSQEWARLNSTSAATEGFVRWYVNTTGQGSACAANNTTKNMLDNEWHCIVFVKEIADGKCVTKVYADGQLTGTSTKQDAKDTMKDPFFIGCTEQFTKTKDHQINCPLVGCFDDIMMYDRPFTATEVANLYNIMK